MKVEEVLDQAPAWVAWLAQDADGTWWGYEVEPNKQDRGWYENEVGRIVRLGQTAPPDDWESMLLRSAPGVGKSGPAGPIRAATDQF